MNVAIPREIYPGERRVAATSETVDKMVKAGLTLFVESDAGIASQIANSEYEKAGAKIVADAASLYANADCVLKVQRPLFNEQTGQTEIKMMREGALLISLLQPSAYPEMIPALTARKIGAFALEMVPRITRAQRMDVLSAMSNIAGYKAVLLAAAAFGKYIPMMTTAAGTTPPARVLILGVGVAGLQAIATAKRLGAVVEAFDVRPAVAEQVKSLGAEFIALDLENEQAEDVGGYAKTLSNAFQKKVQEKIHQHIKNADIVITTALIPGKPAPVLITREMVADMKKGAVIVDLAAEQGGNCELTQAGSEVVQNGITLIGAMNLPSTVPIHASQLYAKNVFAFLSLLYVNKELKIDLNDEIIKGSLVTYRGEIIHSGVRDALSRGGA